MVTQTLRRAVILTRENIKSGYIQRMIAASGGIPGALSESEIVASYQATLACADAGDIWVFGYGSLIWNPAFHFVEKRIGRLHGYHRRFCLWTHLGRGTEECPGLTLGLEYGGSCRGIAFRISRAEAEVEVDVIWRREMISGAYTPRWVDVRTPNGSIRAITFVINRAHDRYAGALTEDCVVEAIARAAGPLGPCADYLNNTVDHLEELGITDRPLTRLRDQVAERTE